MSTLTSADCRFPKTTDIEPHQPTEWIAGANGGRLRRGGRPGNKGGGRPRNDFSLRNGGLTDEGLELLRKIIRLEPIPGQRGIATRSQIIRAVELVAKYSDAHPQED